jgi:hypothetical protein
MDTPVGVPLKERYHNEMAKLRKMNFKQKREYIWEYFKFPIIMLGIALVVAGSIVYSAVFNPPKNTVLYIAWTSGYVLDDNLRYVNGALSEILLENPDKEEVVISPFYADEDPEYVMVQSYRTIAMLSTGEIDIFILEEKLAFDYHMAEFIDSMDELLSQVRVLSPGVYAQISEKTLTSDGAVIGIDIKGCPLFNEAGIFEQELYFCLAITAGNRENAARALIALYE